MQTMSGDKVEDDSLVTPSNRHTVTQVAQVTHSRTSRTTVARYSTALGLKTGLVGWFDWN